MLKCSSLEFLRIARDYSSAVRSGAADGEKLLPLLGAIARARLKYDIGPLFFSLFQLARVPENQWAEYVIDHPDFKNRLKRMDSSEAIRIAQNKLLMFEHCVKNAIPTIPVYCLVGDSPDVTASTVPVVADPDRLLGAIGSGGADFFVKSIDGTYGEGSFPVTRIGPDEFRFDGVHGSAAGFFRFMQSRLRSADVKGWILQPRIFSDPELLKLASSSGLPTIRVVTAMRGGKAHPIVSCFKATVGDNVTDNFAKGSVGNLLAAVDIRSGVLSSAWGSRGRGWPRMICHEKHPHTDHRFAGFRLPRWDDVLDLVVRAQESLPELRSAGWDVAITPERAVIVEANVTYDMAILQVAHQRGLKKLMDPWLAD